MDTASYVPRPSNSKGLTAYEEEKTTSWVVRYGTNLVHTSVYSANRCRQVGFVDTPRNGNILRGFRMPTPWFMVADRHRDYGADYVCRNGTGTYSRYRKFGDEFGYLPCVRTGEVPYDTASRTVSLPWGMSESSNNKALINIRDTHIHVGVAFAEANKTIATIANLIAELYYVYRHARSKDWTTLRKWSRERFGIGGSASTWLEFKYAWLPLMSDIYGLQQQLKDGFREEGFTFKSVGVSRVEWPLSDVLRTNNQCTAKTSGRGFFLSKTVYYCRISDQEIAAASQLGLRNPLEIGWELLPLSFVVDWILPIGDFLGSLGATAGTSFVAGFEDRIAYANVEAEGNVYQYVEGRKGKVSRRVYAFERRTLPTFLTPSLGRGNGMSVDRALSALSLFVQRSTWHTSGPKTRITRIPRVKRQRK